MSDKKVTETGKDDDGDITKLCNPDENWSPREKDDAIDDIENGHHTYYVDESGSDRVDIEVVDDDEKGKYLRTDPDETTENNLDNLPDC